MPELELLLVRHAHAEVRRPGRADAARALTRRGRLQAQADARALRVLQLCPDALWHSPWTRAAETAALLGPACSGMACVAPWLAHAPDARVLSALASVRAAQRTGPRSGTRPPLRVALVGHQPWLSELAAWLLTGERGLRSALRLGKGGVLWLQGEVAPGGMVLRGAFTPKSLRRLGAPDLMQSRAPSKRPHR